MPLSHISHLFRFFLKNLERLYIFLVQLVAGRKTHNASSKDSGKTEYFKRRQTEDDGADSSYQKRRIVRF